VQKQGDHHFLNDELGKSLILCLGKYDLDIWCHENPSVV